MGRFEERAKQIKEDVKYETINILVWGPGDPGSDAPSEKRRAYEKRIQIKEVLRKEFPRAEVYLSEDTEMIKIAEGIHGQLKKEALQASAADLILILDIRRGADLELDHFVATYSWFRDKVFVFLPEQYVPPTQGLVAEVFNYLTENQVEGFSEQEFKDCTVATVKAVRAAHTTAMASYLSRL